MNEMVLFAGNLLAEEEVLDWLVHQVEEDEIEEVTDEMLDRLIGRTEHLAVLFCECPALCYLSLHDMMYIKYR